MIFARTNTIYSRICILKLTCHLRLSKSLLLCLFRCLIYVPSPSSSPPVGFCNFAGLICIRRCLGHVFCDLTHRCAMQRKRERACEIQNPRKGGTKTVRARIHRNSCKAKTFMESLVIGVNFQDTASRQAKSVMAKIIIGQTGSRKQEGRKVVGRKGWIMDKEDSWIWM